MIGGLGLRALGVRKSSTRGGEKDKISWKPKGGEKKNKNKTSDNKERAVMTYIWSHDHHVPVLFTFSFGLFRISSVISGKLTFVLNKKDQLRNVFFNHLQWKEKKKKRKKKKEKHQMWKKEKIRLPPFSFLLLILNISTSHTNMLWGGDNVQKKKKKRWRNSCGAGLQIKVHTPYLLY